MTTEEIAFNAALDANPEDHTTRLVFADWLEERGDPRAEGYRALGRRRFRPHETVMNPDVPDARHDHQWVYGRKDNLLATDRECGGDVNPDCLLPYRWFAELPYTDRLYSFNVDKEDRSWEHFPSRREAEDVAALAFAKLPAERQAELLATPCTAG